MTIIAHPVPGKSKAKVICDAFLEGAPRDAKGHVFYGVNDLNVAEWRKVKASGEDYWFVDNSYFDVVRGGKASRGSTAQFRITKNAVQHSGLGETDGKRFAALGVEIKPWRTGGRTVVICPQSDDFMRNVAEYKGDWLKDTLRGMIQRESVKVKIREWGRDKLTAASTLEADLEDCGALLTYSSAAAVTAVLAGVPAITNPVSPVYGLVQREAAGVDDRLRWAGVLADNQFTLDEIAEGKAWKRIK